MASELRYSTAEAAQKAGVSTLTLKKWIRMGVIPGATKTGGRYLIWRDAFDRWTQGLKEAA